MQRNHRHGVRDNGATPAGLPRAWHRHPDPGADCGRVLRSVCQSHQLHVSPRSRATASKAGSGKRSPDSCGTLSAGRGIGTAQRGTYIVTVWQAASRRGDPAGTHANLAALSHCRSRPLALHYPHIPLHQPRGHLLHQPRHPLPLHRWLRATWIGSSILSTAVRPACLCVRST